MLENISVIAFDIDGTVYSSFSLYVRIVPYILRNLKFFIHYKRVRKILHRTAPLPDFFEYQARLLAQEIGYSVENAKADIKRIVYDGLRPYLEKTKPFPGAEDAIKSFKDAGYTIAILSDFPPEQKGNLWNLAGYCDLVLGTESIGALKPSKYPFGIMARALEVKEAQILYVGNSVKYDVFGAKNAGMKAAYKMPFWRVLLRKPLKNADINFSSYRQLKNIVLK